MSWVSDEVTRSVESHNWLDESAMEYLLICLNNIYYTILYYAMDELLNAYSVPAMSIVHKIPIVYELYVYI